LVFACSLLLSNVPIRIAHEGKGPASLDHRGVDVAAADRASHHLPSIPVLFPVSAGYTLAANNLRERIPCPQPAWVTLFLPVYAHLISFWCIYARQPYPNITDHDGVAIGNHWLPGNLLRRGGAVAKMRNVANMARSPREVRVGIFELISRWIAGRRLKKRLVEEDARRLLELNPRTAFYDAQRFVTRARLSGNSKVFVHWVRVAAEIAKISDNPLDVNAMKVVVDEEERLMCGEAPARLP
jgi:hypothetical protein